MESILTIGVVVFNQEGKILLIRHSSQAQHLTNTYGLPSGRVEEGEDLIDAACREVQEEAGIIVQKESLIKLPTIYEADIPRKDGTIKHFIWHVFLATHYTGELHSSEEGVPEWYDIESISSLNLLPNVQNATNNGKELFKDLKD